MAKKIQIDPRLQELIEKKCGKDIDMSKFSVYQARVVSTEPISQNSWYDKAQMAHSTIFELADLINEDIRNTPIQTMHDGTVLPIGRLIAGKAVEEDNGVTALYADFMVSNEYTDIISRLDSGIIDEVSIGMAGKKLICSECGTDMMELDEGTRMMAYFTNSCPECDGVFGKNGVHLNIVGVKRLSEVSLVGRGAAKNPKILDTAKQISLAASGEQLKASLRDLSELVSDVYLDGKFVNEEGSMTLEELMAKLNEIETKLNSALADVNEKINSLDEKIKASEEPEPVAEPVAEPAPETSKDDPQSDNKELEEAESKLAEANKEIESLKAQSSMVLEFIRSEANKLLVAAGRSQLAEDVSFDEIKKVIAESKATLAATIPVEGVSLATDAGAEKLNHGKYTKVQLEAMKLKK